MEDLLHAIEAAIDRAAGILGPADPEGRREIDRLALEVVAFQHGRVPAYRRLCRARAVDPAALTSWRDSPAVPTASFKEPGLELCAAPPRVTFRSSGTTAGAERRSEHRHPYPDLYRRVVEASFPVACLDPALRRGAARVPMLSLVPPLSAVPDSSLGFLVDHVLRRWGAADSVGALDAGGLDADRARGFLEDSARGRRPVLVLATALALDALLAALADRPLAAPLPPGSVVFETGGFKGRERELSGDLLTARAEQRLGVPRARIVREYGMTELTSQAYTRSLAGGDPDVFATPPWLLWRLVDPATGGEVAPGREGMIAFFDLANLGSVAHVLTEDVGRARPEGGFELLGRARDAELRGCSLTAEELLS
ncbi:MAG TPA: long-chain fatty acid--CoA ligase [Thermoanaerobaculia bacterium]|nr:long-chain fatty acid--CoA ligase [Thermoanaerobaculia bacterium]